MAHIEGKRLLDGVREALEVHNPELLLQSCGVHSLNVVAHDNVPVHNQLIAEHARLLAVGSLDKMVVGFFVFGRGLEGPRVTRCLVQVFLISDRANPFLKLIVDLVSNPFSPAVFSDDVVNCRDGRIVLAACDVEDDERTFLKSDLLCCALLLAVSLSFSQVSKLEEDLTAFRLDFCPYGKGFLQVDELVVDEKLRFE